MKDCVYCTYFDHRYLSRGLALIHSLRRQVPAAEIWVLCLDGKAEEMLLTLREPGVHIIGLADFERGDEDLARARADGRSTIEYYFTLTPSLVRYVMDRAGAEIVTYLDGDMWFMSNPAPIYRAMGTASVLIIPHGFAPGMQHLERFGTYNVGWLSFRDDARGRACLEWWRARTNEWCFDRLEDGRFCEQAYLDQFPRLFEGVHVLRNKGANLAPWNVAASTLTLRDGHVFADKDMVIFFHFHGLKRLESGKYLVSHGLYRAPLSALMRETLYYPYLREILAIECEIETRFGPLERSSVRDLYGAEGGPVGGLKNLVKALRNRWRGYIITVG